MRRNFEFPFKKKNVLKVLMVVILASPAAWNVPEAWSFTPLPGSPMAKGEHPRLLITQDTIPSLRQAIVEKRKSEFQKYVTWVGTQDPNKIFNGIGDTKHKWLRPLLLHQAFIGALGVVPGISYNVSPEDSTRQAIDSFRKYLIDDGQTLGFAAPLVYDWAYNGMTNEERVMFAQAMLTRKITNTEFDHSIANPNVKPDSMFSSRYFGQEFAWAIALALWGDGQIDAQTDAAVDTFQNVMLNYGYLDAQNFIAGLEGGWSEWAGYSATHPGSHMNLLGTLLTASGVNYVAGNGSPFITGNALKTYPQLWIYTTDPHKYNDVYTLISAGDAGMQDLALTQGELRNQTYFLPGLLEKAELQPEAALLEWYNQKYEDRFPDNIHAMIHGFLGLTNTVTPISPTQADFPKSIWFKNMGQFYARTGFDDPADGVFNATGSHFRLGGHQGPMTRPGFGLNKFGALVNSRKSGHRGQGNLNAYPGGQANNIVYFEGGHAHTIEREDLNDPPDVEKASKGQGNFDWGGIEQVIAKNGHFYHVREDTSRRFEPGIKHSREYVWVPGSIPETNSDFLVVYDRTTAPSQPHWIYHVPWEPSITGEIKVEDLNGSEKIGTAYIGPNLIVQALNGTGGPQDDSGGDEDFTQAGIGHGVVFSKTLLPNNARIETTRVATLGKDSKARQGNFAIKTQRWQVDVIPEQKSNTHKFLHVFQTADANNTKDMVPTSLIQAGNLMEGVWIQRESNNQPNFAILFNKNLGTNGQAITYTVTGNGKTKHILTGLLPYTNYKINNVTSGKNLIIEHPTENDMQLWDYKGVATNTPTGTLFFEDTIAGTRTYTITPTSTNGGSPDTSPPAPPSELKVQ